MCCLFYRRKICQRQPLFVQVCQKINKLSAVESAAGCGDLIELGVAEFAVVGGFNVKEIRNLLGRVSPFFARATSI